MSYLRIISKDNTPERLELVTENDKYQDIMTDFDVDHNSNLYLVQLVYTHGDDYKITHGNIDYVGVYETIGEAITIVNFAKNHVDDFQSYFKDVELPSGKIQTIDFLNICGYYNRLESVEYKFLHVH